jgi:hypothetical protein
MKFFKKITVLSALTALSFQLSAQDTRTDNHQITITVPNVALLDLETSGARNFTAAYTATAEAGDPLTAPATNNALWLNYSSIIPSTVTSRRVDVKASALVAGVDISVTAGTSATGFGTKGTPTAPVTLTTTDQPIINTIGSAYTVSGAAKGHQLTYGFTVLDANYGNLRANTTGTAVTVTYTLVDN